MTIEEIEKLITCLMRITTQAADLAMRSALLCNVRGHSIHDEFDKILGAQMAARLQLIEAIKQYKEQK